MQYENKACVLKWREVIVVHVLTIEAKFKIVFSDVSNNKIPMKLYLCMFCYVLRCFCCLTYALNGWAMFAYSNLQNNFQTLHVTEKENNWWEMVRNDAFDDKIKWKYFEKPSVSLSYPQTWNIRLQYSIFVNLISSFLAIVSISKSLHWALQCFWKTCRLIVW